MSNSDHAPRAGASGGKAFLSARGIIKDYRQGSATLRVLKGVNLRIEAGEFLVVAGPSGAGKSTLLHILGLLDTPTSGEVIFEGETISALSRTRQSALRNSLFGFVFQFFHLMPDFTAIENVMMPALVGSHTLQWPARRHAARDRAAALLDKMGLLDRAKHRPTQLSGGEQQRVAICRALMNAPRVLFLDEPTGNLDSATGATILDLLMTLNRDEGQTLIMVTHDRDAAAQAHRTVQLRDGAVVR